MRKLPVIIAAASTLFAVPALAAPPEIGSEPPTGMSRDLGGMKGSLGERRTFGLERGQAMREGCKYITVRQRRGDEIVVRHFKRCD